MRWQTLSLVLLLGLWGCSDDDGTGADVPQGQADVEEASDASLPDLSLKTDIPVPQDVISEDSPPDLPAPDLAQDLATDLPPHDSGDLFLKEADLSPQEDLAPEDTSPDLMADMETDIVTPDLPPPLLLHGEPCDERGDEGCSTGHCLQDPPYGLPPTCVPACDLQGNCPYDPARKAYTYECAPDGDLCIPLFGTSQMGEPCSRLLGYSCTPGLVCQGGDYDPDAYCSKRCSSDTECLPPMECRSEGVANGQKYCLWRRICSPCQIDEDCYAINGICAEDDEGGRFCTEACTMVGSSCPKGFECQDLGEWGYNCYPQDGTCSGTGEPCSLCRTDKDCGVGGYCLEDAWQHISFCGGACRSNADCPEKFTCAEIGTNIYQCMPDNPYMSCALLTDGEMCDSCWAASDCIQGMCVSVWLTGETFCTIDCEDDPSVCPVGTTCGLVDLGSGRYSLECLPNGDCGSYRLCEQAACEPNQYCIGGECRQSRGFCDPCDPEAEDASCGYGNLCVLVGENRICTMDCADNPNVCPEGSACQDITGSGGSIVATICVPTGTCQDWAACSSLPEPCPEGTFCSLGECQPVLDVCQPCLHDGQCGAEPDRCIQDGFALGACGLDCSQDPLICPTGLTCSELDGPDGQVEHQCVPYKGFSCEDFLVCQEALCPQDHYCLDGDCIPLLDLCERCSAPYQCASGTCEVLSGFERLCHLPCGHDQSICPPGTVCTDMEGEMYCQPLDGACSSYRACQDLDVPCSDSEYCIAGECLSREPFCDPCLGDVQCQEGLFCLEGICTFDCSSSPHDCPSGTTCITAPNDLGLSQRQCNLISSCADARACLALDCEAQGQWCESRACRDPQAYCSTCMTDQECGQGNLCLPDGAAQACGLDCQGDPTLCPEGTSCQSVTVDDSLLLGYQCRPLEGTCASLP